MTTNTVHLSAAVVRPRVARSQAPASRLRITRRGRIAFAAVVAAPLVALALWFGLNSGMAGATSATNPASVTIEHVTVTPGESLWQVAQKIAPRQDPRDVVAAIVTFNGLQSSVVMPGQSLAVPPQFVEQR